MVDCCVSSEIRGKVVFLARLKLWCDYFPRVEDSNQPTETSTQLMLTIARGTYDMGEEGGRERESRCDWCQIATDPPSVISIKATWWWMHHLSGCAEKELTEKSGRVAMITYCVRLWIETGRWWDYDRQLERFCVSITAIPIQTHPPDLGQSTRWAGGFKEQALYYVPCFAILLFRFVLSRDNLIIFY